MAKKETDEYQVLIDEFHNEKLLVLEEARKEE